MKKTVLFMAALFLSSILCTSVYAESAKPITVNYVTFTPKMFLPSKMLQEDLAEVEKRSGGKITFKYRGGPEAIPPFEQVSAVKMGAVDMAFVPADFYAGELAAPGMILLTEIPVHEDIKSGAYDFLVKIHKDIGLRYIRRFAGEPGSLFLLTTNKKVEKPEDLAGLSIAGTSIWDAVAPALGMKPVAMTIGEQYQAVERGLIDVARGGADMLFGLKLNEVTKYIIKPSWGSAMPMLLMNPKKWDSMPVEIQEMMVNTLYEIAPQTIAKRSAIEKGMLQKLVTEGGMEVIEFKGDDAARYQKTIKDAVYKYYSELSPEDGPKLYTLLQKQ